MDIPNIEPSLLSHRGPDGVGIEKFDRIVLGHARLSIIDLAGGAQPMSDIARTAIISFNGEIYNYRELRSELTASGIKFATSSDTEVILAVYKAWGISGFAKLRGMYAFAIADRRKNELILCRDPFGIKPLFYIERKGSLFFASELFSLISMLPNIPDIDVTSVLEILNQRHITGNSSLYCGVRRVEPGVALVIPSDTCVPSALRFASLSEEIEKQRNVISTATAAEVLNCISDSVAHHAVSDVPVGCFLSGGLDSSIVTEQLSRIVTSRLQAYSVGFSDASSEKSELPHAQAVARHLGVDLHAIELTAEDFAELAPRLSGTPNGPFPDPADIAMLRLAHRAAADVKVVLSGEGSDEAFAGYPKYAFDRLARFARPIASRLARARIGQGRIAVSLNAFAEGESPRRWMRWFANDPPPPEMVQELHRAGADECRALTWTRERIKGYPRQWSDLQRMQTLDLESWLPNNLLHRGDYTTMQASLEQRVPFLDIKTTPFAVALPDRMKIRMGHGKAALRQAFASRLPNSVLHRAKSGFRLPLGEWMRTNHRLREVWADHCLGADSRLTAMVGPQTIETIFSPQSLASTPGAKLAWTVLSLELWLRSLSGVALQQAPFGVPHDSAGLGTRPDEIATSEGPTANQRE